MKDILHEMSLEERDGVTKQIIAAYTEDLTPIIEIASWLNVSRQAIWRLLKRHGVDTQKSRRFEVKCHYCEKTFLKKASQVRRRNYHYHNSECYLDYIKEIGQPYVQNRHGQRRARTLVNTYFPLDDDMIVHHENKDTLHNVPFNLRVFKNHSEHMKYHRGGKGEPIWDGREISQEQLCP